MKKRMIKKGSGKNKKNRLSQVTIFIIIAIVLVILFILFFSLASGFSIFGFQLAPPEVESILNYGVSCIKETGKNAIIFSGIYGGYYESNYTTLGGTPYYYDFHNNELSIPTKKMVEDGLNKYMNNYLKNCDFNEFNGYSVTKGKIETDTLIKDNKVIFNVKYPLKISKGNYTYFKNDFNGITIPVKLGIIISSVQDYFNQSSAHSGGVCLTCLYDIGEKDKLYFELYNYDNETTLFVVRDKTMPLGNYSSYQFNFAAKYPQNQHLTKDTQVVIK